MPRRDWTAAPILFVPKPVCPVCGGDEFERFRTDPNGDGTSCRRFVCLSPECGQHFKIVEESSQTGIETVWPL